MIFQPGGDLVRINKPPMLYFDRAAFPEAITVGLNPMPQKSFRQCRVALAELFQAQKSRRGQHGEIPQPRPRVGRVGR